MKHRADMILAHLAYACMRSRSRLLRLAGLMWCCWRHGKIWREAGSLACLDSCWRLSRYRPNIQPEPTQENAR